MDEPVLVSGRERSAATALPQSVQVEVLMRAFPSSKNVTVRAEMSKPYHGSGRAKGVDVMI